jgi:3-deoxy-D-arabino-heptulosonate 7-phosphate (DAHP) synthase
VATSIGEEGLDLYDYVHKDLDLATATEVTSEHEVDLVIDKVDIPWIGARGMRVPNLIRYAASEAKKRNKPILIKRTFDSEWLRRWAISPGDNMPFSGTMIAPALDAAICTSINW